MADIKYIITVDAKNAQAVIKAFGGELGGLAKISEDKTRPALGSLWKQFAIGQIAANAVMKGIRLVSGELRGTITAAIDSEHAVKGLESALSVTGRTVDTMLPGLIAFADDIQNQTTYTDEAALSAMALLTQLTNLDSNGIKVATEGALGLASVFAGQGLSVDTAARAVAKAMEGNYDALGRYIPQLAAAKTAGEKHAIVMDAMAKGYQRSKDEVGTFGGALAQLRNRWDEVKETIGNAVIKNEAINKALQDLSGWVKKLSESDDFKLWLNTVIDLTVKAAEAIGKFAGGIKGIIDSLAGAKGAEDEFAKSQETLNEHLRIAAERGHQFAIDALDRMRKSAEEVRPEIEAVGEKTKTASDRSLAFTKVIKDQNSALAAAGINLREYLGGLRDAPGYYNAILPPARDMTKVLEQAADKMYDMTTAAKKTTKETGHYFDGLYNDIATGWGNTIEKWMSGATTFKDFMKSLWDDVKNSFFRVIGEMAAKFAIDLIKELIAGVTTAATATGTALASIGTAIGGIGAGLASLIVSLATAIATAAGILAAAAAPIAIVAGLALAIYASALWVKGLMGKIFGGGGGGSSDVTYWLKLIYEWMGKQIMEKFDGLKGSMDLTRDSMLPVLAQIRDNTDCLKNIQYGQHGLDAVVHRPTLFMAGERGAERVTINRGRSSGATVVNVYLDGEKIGGKVISTVKRAARLGRLTFPAKAVT